MGCKAGLYFIKAILDAELALGVETIDLDQILCRGAKQSAEEQIMRR